MGGETGERGGAGQRDQGSTEKSRGHTQGAQEQQGTRGQKNNNSRTGHKEEAGRGTWGEQGANEGAKEHNVSQRSAMPMTRIELYRPPRPTIRELMEGRPAGEDDGGVPPEGVTGKAAQVGLQVGRQGGGPETREGARDTTMARRRPAASTRSRRTTLRGRAGDRGEGRVERRESGYMYGNKGGMAGSPGMAGDRQGQRHRMAEGLDESAEQNRDR